MNQFSITSLQRFIQYGKNKNNLNIMSIKFAVWEKRHSENLQQLSYAKYMTWV